MVLIRRSTSGRSMAICGCLVVAGAAAAGCGDLGPQSTRSTSYQVTGQVTRLVVQDAAGSVHVSAGSGNAIGVTEAQSYHSSPPASSHAVRGGTLTLTYTCPDGNCGIDYTVTVPAGLSVQVGADAGDVTLSGVGGAVAVDASAGEVTLANLSGALQVQADAGDIRATGLSSARAKLVADAGEVTLGFNAAPGNLFVQADAGSVRVTVPGSIDYAVTATASAGGTHVTVPTSTGSAHVIQAQSDAGSVSVLAG
jgi:DUF4097 and DUF4098 domain-containing protein YvlB